MKPQHPLPRCVRLFIHAAELEADRIFAVRDELPRDYWPAWMPEDGGNARLMFQPAAPGLMTSVPPVGGRLEVA